MQELAVRHPLSNFKQKPSFSSNDWVVEEGRKVWSLSRSHWINRGKLVSLHLVATCCHFEWRRRANTCHCPPLDTGLRCLSESRMQHLLRVAMTYQLQVPLTVTDLWPGTVGIVGTVTSNIQRACQQRCSKRVSQIISCNLSISLPPSALKSTTLPTV